jgi:hypothetical protein
MSCRICGEKDLYKFYKYKNGKIYKICKKCCYNKNIKRKTGLTKTRKKMKNKEELEIIKNKLNDKMYMDNAVEKIAKILAKGF